MRPFCPARAVPVTLVTASLTAASLIVPSTHGADSAAAATMSPIRITTAQTSVVDSTGKKWEARRGFTGGRYANSYAGGGKIAGSNEQQLYRHELVAMSGFSQAVPTGSYRVTLKMREFWWNKPGQRVFSVDAEGRRALSDVDIVKAAGKHKAYDRSFDVAVTDGRLDLRFPAKTDVALVSALEIVPLTEPGATHMTVLPTPTTSVDGTVYQARNGFVGGRFSNANYVAGTDIKSTTDDALYYPEYVQATGWQRTVANGSYDVTLKMREAWFTKPGQRVFSVDAEGKRALTDVDIVKAVGRHTAYDRTFRVNVADGRLDLAFSAKANGSLISAIAVKPVTRAPAPAPSTPMPQGVTGTWNLTMRDDFDGTSLNTSVWTPHRGLDPYTYGHPYNANLDDYAFDPSRVSVRDGHLRLSWDRTPITVQNSTAPFTTTYPYTAGVAHTGKGFSFAHGFVEARIWVPQTPGIWPAFWMLPTPVDKDWPPEIDIAEIIPDDTPDGLYKPHFNYHFKDAAGNNQQAHWKWYGEAGKSYAGSWHTYGLLWEKGRLQVFLDGKPGPSYTGAEVTDNPMYIVLSSGVRKGHTPADGAMLVDYLRVWKRG